MRAMQLCMREGPKLISRGATIVADLRPRIQKREEVLKDRTGCVGLHPSYSRGTIPSRPTCTDSRQQNALYELYVH